MERTAVIRQKYIAVFLTALAILIPEFSQAAKVWMAQTSTGSGDGSTSGNRMSIAAVNASWPLNPGDTLSLSGTITNQILVRGSGTAGNLETIFFESGANMSQTNWGPYANGGCAINLNGNYYIHIDGGVNGLIQATGTGTGIYTNDDVGIGGSAYFITINNMRITNMYTKVKGVLDDTRVGYPISLSGSSITYSNNVVSDGDCGLTYSPGDASQSNYLVLGNTVLNCNHSTQIGMANSNCYLTNVIFANNYFDHWDVWDCPGNTQIHLDGIWIWNNTYDPSSFLTGVQIYNNLFGGFVGTRTTAAIAAYLYNAPYQCANAFLFNNTFKCFYPGSWGGGFIGWGTGSNTFILNNTIIGTITNGTLYGGRIAIGTSPAYCYNNLCYYSSGVQILAGTSNSVATDNSGSTTANNLTNYFQNIWTDYNVWYDQGNGLAQFSCEYDQAPNGVSWVSGGLYPLSVWQTWNNNNRGMPQPIWNLSHSDQHSTTNQVTFVGSTFQPAASDTTARLAGTNLTLVANAFNVPALLNDSAGVPHPTTGPWTIGALEAASSGPTTPAFTVQPASLINITNYSEVFNWAATGDSSQNWYRVQLTNGTAISAWKTSANWSTNSPLPLNNYFVVVVTNDAALYITSSIASFGFTNGVLPVITGQPASVTTLTNAAGVTESFTCTATGALNYQWYSVSNATTAPSIGLTLTTNSAVAQTNAFYLVASNPAGSVTSSVAIWITTNSIGLPVFVSNPSTVQNITNTTFVLTAIATGTGPITHQWFNTNGWVIAPSITGTLTTNVQTVGTNWYADVASNGGGSTTSAVAGILVTNGISIPQPTTFLIRARTH